LGNREPRKKDLNMNDEPEKITYKTMAFKVEEHLHTALKLHAVKKNEQIGAVVNDLLRAYLKEQGEI
jgi:predicted HicB family RNase H-like nuclease